jgi:hypothetical protein
MVYVCKIGDDPNLRLFPERNWHQTYMENSGRHGIQEDEDDFVRMRATIPYTNRTPRLSFVETTKFTRSTVFNEDGHVGEFEIAVVHPNSAPRLRAG